LTDLSIPVEDAVLAARLSLPEGGPAAAVVALHGAERGLKDWYLYEHLHEVLPPAGIAAVTFDRRGEGGSTGESSRGKFTLQAEDALAVVAHVAGLPEVDAGRVGLWGISQGGWVAPLAATLSDSVAYLVLVASVGVTPGEQMRWTSSFQAGREYGEGAGEKAGQLWTLVLEWMRGADRGRLETAVAEAKADEWWPKAFLPDEVPGDEEREEVRDELDFDPTPVFAAVEVPTLLFYGDQDEWIPVPESIAAWKKARPDADVIVIPGTGHEPALDEVVDQLYERTMVDWLRRLA
jgi:uncharacterized protein